MAKKRKQKTKKTSDKNLKDIVKKPKLKKRNINIQSNILLNKWIWISLAIAFMISVGMFVAFFLLKGRNQIDLSYAILILIALCPFIIFMLYWSTIGISYRLTFKAITKDIEKDAVFPIASSFLIQEPEVSVAKYIEKGNLSKIKRYKKETSQLLAYTSITVVLFIVFNFVFVGLTELQVISVSLSWLYLFGLLSNIISLILSSMFGYMVGIIIEGPAKFEEKYEVIKTKLSNFKVFLNVNDLKKTNPQELKSNYIDFLPLYFYQSLLIPKIKTQQYIQELENWKYYLTLSSYLNQFSWLLFLNHSMNKEDQLRLFKKRKYIGKLATQIKKVHTILFHTSNDFIYFNNDYDAKQLAGEYSKLMRILVKYKNRFTLKMITAALEKNGLKISQTVSENKDENIIDERDVDINFYQLNYLEYLFSIIFVTEKDSKSKEHFKF